MALQTLNTIKNWFKTGLKPTQSQFWDTWDSFRHKYDKIPVDDIQGINELLQNKTEIELFQNHLTDSHAHVELIKDKLEKGGYNGTAKDLNDKIETIESPDTLLESVKPARIGAAIIFPAMKYIARINQTIVTNPLKYSNTIDVATANYYRTDLIELHADGTFNKVIGEESLTAAIKPNRSSNAVEVSTINVFGNIISNPSDPFDPTDFLPKGGYSGTGQDLANAIPDLNVLNLKLGGYPNTRNDGQLPTNKVLGTDENGNLKMFTIAVTPAPYLSELIPDSYLPNTTGNFILKGSFFTPTMSVIIQGQTINYTTFISDNEFHVNVTTGIGEGNFDVILNNGISKTFPKALLIILGRVRKLSASDFPIISQSINDPIEGFLKYNVLPNIEAYAKGFVIPANKDFRVTYSKVQSPFGYSFNDRNSGVTFTKMPENTMIWRANYHYGNHNTICSSDSVNDSIFGFLPGGNYYFAQDLGNVGSEPTDIITLERVAGVFRFKGASGSAFATSAVIYNGELTLNFTLLWADLANLKYIELAI